MRSYMRFSFNSELNPMMKKKNDVSALMLSILLLFASFSLVNPVVSIEKFEPNWDSLAQYQCPDWFRDAKFGIYAHWGPYTVPQFFSEWYSHWMYQPGHEVHQFHVENFGPLDKFGYKDFIPMFSAEKFDADEWAELYHKAGSRFAGPVVEHADGFAMWDSALTEWDAKDKGPKRDIVDELEKAVRKRGMKFMTTLHHTTKWGWYATNIKDTVIQTTLDCTTVNYLFPRSRGAINSSQNHHRIRPLPPNG